jgi:hypothetical protein
MNTKTNRGVVMRKYTIKELENIHDEYKTRICWIVNKGGKKTVHFNNVEINGAIRVGCGPTAKAISFIDYLKTFYSEEEKPRAKRKQKK